MTRLAGTTVASGSYLDDDLVLFEDDLLFLLLDLERSAGFLPRCECATELELLLLDVPTEGTFLGLWLESWFDTALAELVAIGPGRWLRPGTLTGLGAEVFSFLNLMVRVLLLLLPFSADVEKRIVEASICSSKSSQLLYWLLRALTRGGLTAAGSAGGRSAGCGGCLGGRSFCGCGGGGLCMGCAGGTGLAGGCRWGVVGLGTDAVGGAAGF